MKRLKEKSIFDACGFEPSGSVVFKAGMTLLKWKSLHGLRKNPQMQVKAYKDGTYMSAMNQRSERKQTKAVQYCCRANCN